MPIIYLLQIRFLNELLLRPLSFLTSLKADLRRTLQINNAVYFVVVFLGHEIEPLIVNYFLAFFLLTVLHEILHENIPIKIDYYLSENKDLSVMHTPAVDYFCIYS